MAEKAVSIGIAFYWLTIAVIFGIHVWVAKGLDFWTNLTLFILVVLGIGYTILFSGETLSTSFISKSEHMKSLKEIETKINKLENDIKELKTMVEKILKALEE